MRIISIIGTKNTGKTLLSTKIIEELVKRDYSVGSIKHSHHKLNLDSKKTDTAKHAEAGAKIVMGSGLNSIIQLDDELSLDQLLFQMKSLKNPDYVVIEGFKKYGYPNISTINSIKNNSTIKIVNPFNLTEDDIKDLVNLIEKESCTMNKNKSCADEKNPKDNDDVILSIDNKIILINKFVRGIIDETINGILNTLKLKEYGAENRDKIEILIENSETKLLVDNQDIELNHFVESFLKNTTIGIVKSLKIDGFKEDNFEKIQLLLQK